MVPLKMTLDANVFIASLSPLEKYYPVARDLMTFIRNRDVVLYEPALVLFEVTSALYQKRCSGDFDQEEFDQTLDHFFNLPLLLIWKVGFMKEACQIARQMETRKIYDSSYLAIASTHRATLITFDDELQRKGKRFFRHIHSPEEVLELAS